MSMELAAQSIGLAKFVALKFVGKGIELDDLIGIASLALVKAAKKFDADRGIKFSTYAAHGMAHEIFQTFRSNNALKRIKGCISLDAPLNDSERSSMDVPYHDLAFDVAECYDIIKATDPILHRVRVMYHVKGYKQDEIAEMLGVSQKTISKYLKRKETDIYDKTNMVKRGRPRTVRTS